MNLRFQLAWALGILVLILSSQAGFSQLPTGFGQPGSAVLPASATQSEVSASRTIRVDAAQVFCIHKIQIAAQADGLVNQLMVDEGHAVTKGDTLLIIDNRVAMAEVSVAQKEMEAAEKQAQQTADIEYAKKASEVSDAEYEDIFKLYNQNSANYSEARRKLLEKERARLGIDVAEVKHETDILAAEVASEKVRAAQVKLDLYNVTAPYDGVIVQRLRDQGEWIRAGEPILKLFSLNEMKVEAYVNVDGISLSQLEGAPVTVSVQINPQQVATFTATVEFVSPEIESRTVRIWTRIKNEKVNNSWLLRDGMTANLEISLGN
jgi:multidrug efflux pump subunit AcrA (membrane-fusion protein)